VAQVDGFCISTSHTDEIGRIPVLLPSSWQYETIPFQSVNVNFFCDLQLLRSMMPACPSVRPTPQLQAV